MLRLVLGQGLRVAVVGIAIGAASAVFVTQVLASYLYGVSATDPRTFVLLSIGLTAVAVVASLVPAMRATALDPTIVLRSE